VRQKRQKKNQQKV